MSRRLVFVLAALAIVNALLLGVLVFGENVSARPAGDALVGSHKAIVTNAQGLLRPADTDTPGDTDTPTSTPTSTNTPDPCAPLWSVVNSPNIGISHNYLNGVAAVSANDIWAVGYYQTDSPTQYHTLVEHWDGVSWSVVSSPNPSTGSERLWGVAAVSANDVWAVGDSGSPESSILHWNGTAWSTVSDITCCLGYHDGVAAVSANDVWVVAGSSAGVIWHWNGTAWSMFYSVGYLYGVAAISSNNVWAVGYYYNVSTPQTLVEHWDGVSWSVVPSPNLSTRDNILNGVTAISANDVWAVGYEYTGQALTEHWDGTSWSVVPSPYLGGPLNGVTAVSSNDVWAVGSSPAGLVLHWDGAAWSVVASPNPGMDSYVNGAAAVSANDVWAVGSYYNGSITQTLVEHYISPCTPTSTPTITPTNTPTDTPTTTPTPLLIGHMTWQGPPAQPNARQQQPITLTLKLGATEINYPSQNTDASGFFTVSLGSLANGTYQWRAKGPKYLANSGTVNLPLEGYNVTKLQGSSGNLVTFQPSNLLTAPVEMGLMKVGDANNDNAVSILDMNIEKRTFALCIGDPGYDSRGDFDNSNCVSVVDFNLLKGNFGFAGSPPIHPGNP